MASDGKRGRRALVAWFFGLWLLEWVFGWSGWLGPLEGMVEIVWFLGLAYFVLESRSGSLPRALHTWGWMSAVLAIVALRAWWIGGEGFLLFTEIVREAEPHWRPPFLESREFTAIDSFATSMFFGLGIGLLGLFEAAIIAMMSRVGDLFRAGGEAARVGVLPRLALTILQAPIFLALMGVGLTALAGALGTDAHPGRDMGRPDVDYNPLLGVITGIGLGAWALAVVHLRRLEALAVGGLLTRLILGGYALASAVVFLLFVGPGVGSVLVALVWLFLQIAAIRWARPAAAPMA